MIRQAIQGARWYHHVAHACPFPASRSVQRSFTAITCRNLKYGGPNDKVNFFEQDAFGSKTVRPIDPEAEDCAHAEEVKNELAKLDHELRILKEGPFGPNSTFMKELPDEDRSIALEALRKYEAEHGPEDDDDIGLDQVFDEELDDMLREEFEGLAKEEEEWQSSSDLMKIERPIVQRTRKVLPSYKSHPYVARFKATLMKYSQDRSNENRRQELWAWYRRCRHLDTVCLRDLSAEEVNLLWDSQTRIEASPAVRSHRLQVLVEDSMALERRLSIPHILAFIQALADSGETNKALDQWEAHQTELSQTKADLEEYWKLGVQLFAAANNPQRAQDIALAFLANDKSRQPRILIPVITAWARQSENDAAAKSWALYLQLKLLLGSEMKMEDYDIISIGLLKADRLSLALAVFKDMMVSGRDPGNDSTARYKAALGLTGNLQATSVSVHDVNKVSLSALTILPRRFQNRFFYASWMKKLIGMKEVDSAALVVELMYERGVRPDSKHLNGIIAGWLREGNSPARNKAERLGWAMIQQRIDYVWERGFPSQPDESSKPTVPKLLDGAKAPNFLHRTVPPANIETFSILLLHYTRTGDDDMVKYLLKCLDDARIQPNSYIMNHLLYSELRKRDVRSLWKKFLTMSTSVKPDLETYACLWDCCKIQYDRARWSAFCIQFPHPRGLFNMMIDWHSQLTPRGQRNTKEEFSKDLYHQIIRSFCLKQDLQGTLVALYSMKHAFGIFPDDATARMIILQVASMAAVPPDIPKIRLRRLSTRPRSKESILQASRLVQILSDRRLGMLEAQGLSLESLDPAERQENQLAVLADFLRVMMTKEFPRPDRIEKRIRAAAEEMGVPEIDVGSPLDNGMYFHS